MTCGKSRVALYKTSSVQSLLDFVSSLTSKMFPSHSHTLSHSLSISLSLSITLSLFSISDFLTYPVIKCSDSCPTFFPKYVVSKCVFIVSSKLDLLPRVIWKRWETTRVKRTEMRLCIHWMYGRYIISWDIIHLSLYIRSFTHFSLYLPPSPSLCRSLYYILVLRFIRKSNYFLVFKEWC